MLDFDRFMAERDRERLTVRAFGQNWSVPAALPAWIPLALARARQEGRGQGAVLLEAARLLLGEDFLEETARQPDFGVDDLNALLEGLFRLLGGGEDAGEGEAPGKA